MLVTRMLIPVLLLCLAAPASLPAATVSARCLIVGQWIMSEKDAKYSFIHHVEFTANGELMADDETLVEGKKTVNHCQGTYWFEGKMLVIVSWGMNQPHRVEKVKFKISNNQLELSDQKDMMVFQRVK